MMNEIYFQNFDEIDNRDNFDCAYICSKIRYYCTEDGKMQTFFAL